VESGPSPFRAESEKPGEAAAAQVFNEIRLEMRAKATWLRKSTLAACEVLASTAATEPFANGHQVSLAGLWRARALALEEGGREEARALLEAVLPTLVGGPMQGDRHDALLDLARLLEGTRMFDAVDAALTARYRREAWAIERRLGVADPDVNQAVLRAFDVLRDWLTGRLSRRNN